MSANPDEEDYDPENDPLTVISAGPADIGTASLDPRTGLVTYIPDCLECDRIAKSEENRQYIVTIPYTIMDEDDKLTDSAYIYITVKCIRVAPIANDDYDETEQTSSETTDVLENDEDPNDPADRIFINEITEQPKYGTAIQRGNVIEYTPTRAQEKCTIAGKADSFIDSYKYNVIDTNDNLISNEATVFITVKCNRKPPKARDVEEIHQKYTNLH